MSSMKILTLDIETAPILCYTWGLWNQNISIENIVKPTYMICWAAKWVGGKKIYFRDHRDPDFLEVIYTLLEEADAVITFNGISFDMKHLNREFIEAGALPPFLPTDIDLLRTVRKHFKFPSNKMAYVASRILGPEFQKQSVPYSLWLRVMLGQREAYREMRRYNKQDVLVTEEMYRVLMPWITNHPNHGLFVEDQDSPVCRNCGSTHVQSRGWQHTAVRGYQRYKCMDCGANLRGRNMIKGGKLSPQVTI